MPVSKSKRRVKDNARKREETKRLNRVRGMLGNNTMSAKETKFYLKAVKDKKTPKQFLDEVHADTLAILEHFKLIQDTNENFVSQPEFEAAFKQAWPQVYTNVVDAVQTLTAFETATTKLYNDNIEHMTSLGTVLVVEHWAECMGLIEGYTELQSLIQEAAHDLMLVIKSLLTCLNEAQQFTEVNMVEGA